MSQGKTDLFTVKLGCYENNNAELHQSLLDFCQSLERDNKGRELSNRGGFQSNDLEIVGVVQDFVQFFLRSSFNAYLKDDFLFSEARLQIQNMWANVNYKYSYNTSHIHPGSDFAFVYYVKVPENSGNLILYHPSPSIVHSEFFNSDKQTKYTPANSMEHLVRPIEGHVYFFPSDLMHSVEQSMSEHKRITIAGNLRVDIV